LQTDLILPQALPILLFKAPLIEAAHLLQILLALLPPSIAIIFPALKLVLPGSPGRLLAPLPLRPLRIRPAAIVVPIVA
jgi:hypothetical protein